MCGIYLVHLGYAFPFSYKGHQAHHGPFVLTGRAGENQLDASFASQTRWRAHMFCSKRQTSIFAIALQTNKVEA